MSTTSDPGVPNPGGPGRLTADGFARRVAWFTSGPRAECDDGCETRETIRPLMTDEAVAAAGVPVPEHSQPPRRPRAASFAHASEAELARILDFYAVRWEYEPRA